jgi:hypothetical protein
MAKVEVAETTPFVAKRVPLKAPMAKLPVVAFVVWKLVDWSEEEKRVEVVALVAWRVVWKAVVVVEFVPTSVVAKKVEVVAFVAWRVEAKKLVDVALVVVELSARSAVAKRLVVVALVDVLLTMLRLLMVLDAAFTCMPPVKVRSVEVASPGNGQENPEPPVGHVVRQTSPVKQMEVAVKLVEVPLVARKTEAKSDVEVALVVVELVAMKLEANELVEVELVLLAFTPWRF